MAAQTVTDANQTETKLGRTFNDSFISLQTTAITLSMQASVEIFSFRRMIMHRFGLVAIVGVFLAAFIPFAGQASGQYWDRNGKHGYSDYGYDEYGRSHRRDRVQLGPRPYWLVDDMEPSPLKEELSACKNVRPRKSDFSIGHRGAPLQFPEHTRESYEAAARMGAGILECDVSFTGDGELVCRHSECDLHTTTNILAIPELRDKCSVPFSPAVLAADGSVESPASARCCTSDLTVGEFKMLSGKMDAFNRAAQTPEEFLGGTASWRTDLYSNRGTLLTHRESIELFRSLGAKFTPELKSANQDNLAAAGLTQETYAQKLIDEYRAAGIRPRRVWAQSFNLNDVLYWIENEPRFGRQAVFLDGRYSDPAFDHTNPNTYEPTMAELTERGVRIIAPPTWMLLQNDGGRIAPSVYAGEAKAAGLDIITWTLERSGLLATGGGFYYQTISDITNNDGDVFEALDVLAQDVGVIGVFSDWPATTTFYANCMGIR